LNRQTFAGVCFAPIYSKMRTLLSSIIFFTSIPSLAATLPTADSLLKGWRNAIYTDREKSKLTLTLIDTSAGRVKREAEIWYKSKSGKDSRILMRFISPAQISGVAFLSVRENTSATADQWLYFPAYRKARRLSSHSRDEAFLDSDFSNGDISFEYEDSFDYTVTGESKLGQQSVYIVEGIAKAAKKAELPYSRQVLYFTKDSHLNLRGEFYDKQNQLTKTLNVNRWKKYGSHWAADSVEVANVKSGHRSLLEFSTRDISANPSDSLFTISELERGR
jgi:hypothetical protein